MKWFSEVEGSIESVVEPWPIPYFNKPPRFGVAASTLLAIESAVGSAMLVASKERTNVRRSI